MKSPDNYHEIIEKLKKQGKHNPSITLSIVYYDSYISAIKKRFCFNSYSADARNLD